MAIANGIQVPENFVEWATTLAVQFRTEGATDELIQGVKDFDHKVRAQAREATGPGSRCSPSKRSKGKRAALAASTASMASLDIDNESPSPDAGDVASSLERYVDDEEEEDEDEDEDRGRSVRRYLDRAVRERSLSPRLCELVGRAFIQYLR